jgi:hypothetical protein
VTAGPRLTSLPSRYPSKFPTTQSTQVNSTHTLTQQRQTQQQTQSTLVRTEVAKSRAVKQRSALELFEQQVNQEQKQKLQQELHTGL